MSGDHNMYAGWEPPRKEAHMKAFPTAADNGHSTNQDGMDLRDYFAAKAMQGMLADHTRDNYPEEHAAYAYKIADAMMKARKETK